MPPQDDQKAPVSQEPIAPATDAGPAPAPPGIVAAGERRLDPRSIPADRLSGGIFATVLSGVMLIAAIIVGVAGPWGLTGVLLLLCGWLALSVLVAALLLWWPSISYRHTSYEVTDRGIRIRRGVLWRTVSAVPRTRVQHTDVSQGPIERMFGLATLVIYTAGTHDASVSLGGLSRETAFGIRDHLIAVGQDDAV